jgi:hypothetical protein
MDAPPGEVDSDGGGDLAQPLRRGRGGRGLHGLVGAGGILPHVALIDDDDYPVLSRFKWFLHSEGYAFRHAKIDGKVKSVYLQNQIMEPRAGRLVTFKDKDPLNCQRDNLIEVTVEESRRMARPRKNASSKYKGVSFHKATAKYTAHLHVNGDLVYLGIFPTEEEAAKVYDQKAYDHFGSMAYFNFPDELVKEEKEE